LSFPSPFFFFFLLVEPFPEGVLDELELPSEAWALPL
jgi:hypothetical protein